MSDNAESPTESQKEELQPPSDDSATNEEKKKSKREDRDNRNAESMNNPNQSTRSVIIAKERIPGV